MALTTPGHPLSQGAVLGGCGRDEAAAREERAGMNDVVLMLTGQRGTSEVAKDAEVVAAESQGDVAGVLQFSSRVK